MPAVITPRPAKAVGEDAAFQILAKGLADVGLGAVVVALAVELAGTGQPKLGLEVFGNGAVKQGSLGVARVVELGLCTRCGPTSMRVRVRWACGGRHGVGQGYTIEQVRPEGNTEFAAGLLQTGEGVAALEPPDHFEYPR